MKKLIITAIIFLFAASGYAQTNLFAIGWEINFPSNTDYISKTSYAGGKIDYRHFFKKNISAGLALNWATYEEYLPRQTFVKPDGNSAVTSDFVAQSYQLPITATVHYYFKESKRLKPYAGIALGGQYLQQSLYYNVYVSDDDNWGFVARPEVGVIIKPNEYKEWGILVAANYSYATNTTDLLDLNSFKNFGITLGIGFWQ
jgi:outer membrane protein W